MSEPNFESDSLLHLHFGALSNMYFHASLSSPAIGLIVGAINIEDTIQSNFPMDFNLLGQFIKLKGKNVLGWYGYKLPEEHKFKIHKQLEGIAKKSLIFVEVENLQIFKVTTGTDSLTTDPIDFKVLTKNNELVNMIKLAAQNNNTWSNKRDIKNRQILEMIKDLDVIEKVLDKVDKKTYHDIYKLVCQVIHSQ